MFVWILSFVLVILFYYWKPFIFEFGARWLDAPGRAIFITGCDSGIGRYLAIFFNSIGCTIFAGCLNPDVARSDLPQEITTIQIDITSDASVKAAAETLRLALTDRGIELWAIINNAGVCILGEFDWMTMKQINSQVNVNLIGTMRVTKTFLPLIRKSKGRIVNITSVNGSTAYPGLAVYSATKFGLEGFSHALRQEVLKHGVRVVIIQPGDFAKLTGIMALHRERVNEMWEAMSEEDRKFYGSYFHDYHENVLRNSGITSPPSFEASTLARDAKHAVLRSSPREKYTSASIPFRLFFDFLSWMPNPVSDYIIYLLTRSVFKVK